MAQDVLNSNAPVCDNPLYPWAFPDFMCILRRGGGARIADAPAHMSKQYLNGLRTPATDAPRFASSPEYQVSFQVPGLTEMHTGFFFNFYFYLRIPKIQHTLLATKKHQCLVPLR